MEKTSLQQFSEEEFIELAEKILLAQFPTTDELLNAAMQFVLVSGHPAGTDLICYPEEFNINGPKSMVDVIKLWRVNHGLPGFRIDSISIAS
ncbi:bacteriocin immunity protein [Erwiniaceae bacterium BAC15a-03b]|uniref:Bacteriocin immunity protein n=1 Tax=Winslowiella arboricola TaxID=2978220 RepID=A0A9J6PE83_9GAMM|nr:bacteriocin immunity protein [Winslowiella arboricola]MCU5773495.1 bacteriocin immunity protein [Winslowiella arboricola]MCU5776593.1 bacteriocin immunity protein [Winslowiella arboricola]